MHEFTETDHCVNLEKKQKMQTVAVLTDRRVINETNQQIFRVIRTHRPFPEDHWKSSTVLDEKCKFANFPEKVLIAQSAKVTTDRKLKDESSRKVT